MFRIIPTRVHGAMDYLVGALLLAMPWLAGLPTGEAPGVIFIILGVAALAYSLFTRYEWGLVPLLPMTGHLTLDAAHGMMLAASPWLFGFADRVWAPHLGLGLFELVVVALSSPEVRAVRSMAGRAPRPA